MSNMTPFSMMMGMGQPDQSEEDGDLVPGSSATFPLGVNGGAQNGKNEKKAGKNGKTAPRFDGTLYMRGDFRERQTPFTLSFFVNWQADLSDAQTAAQHLFSVKLQNGEDGLFCLPDAKETMENGDVINGLLLRAVCYDKSGWQRQSFYYPAAYAVSNALPAFTWHHIAFVAEERRVTLYLDGLLWKTAELSFDYSAMKADTLLIGANDTASVRFTGLMQDMRLYDGVLTAEQVCRLAKDADPFDATVAVTPASYAPTAAKEAVTEKSYVAKTADGKTGAAAAGEYQLHRFAGCNIQRVQLARAGKVGQPFGLQRRCRIGDAEGERREILPGGEGEMPLAGSLLPPAIRRDALGGLLGRKDAAAGQLLELCIAPDAGQHDESRQQGGKNENGPFLLHGDASPCGCKKNKVYYSISNRAKKGEG